MLLPINFALWKKNCQQDLHIASLDISSLFTNIPLDKTIDICIGNLKNDNKNPLTSQSMLFVICLT